MSGRHGRLLPHNPGFPRVRGGSQGAVGTLSSSPALQPGPSGAERLSWSEGWATYGSGSNLCCQPLAACCPHILWVLTPTSSPRGLGNPQTVAIQTCSGTTLHEKINIYIYILFCLFLKKEKKGGVFHVSWVSSVSPHQAAPYCLWRISGGWGLHCECSPGSTVSVSGGHWGMECGQGDL